MLNFYKATSKVVNSAMNSVKGIKGVIIAQMKSFARIPWSFF